MPKQEDYIKFKSVLEYFVTHLLYIHNSDANSPGYSKYIKPYLDRKNFCSTGKQDSYNLQSQIKEWNKLSIGQVCLSFQNNFGQGYNTRKCYINWLYEGVNVFAKWQSGKISHLFLCDYIWWIKNPEYRDVPGYCFSLEELGLFQEEETDLFHKFTDKYFDMMIKTRNQRMTDSYNKILEGNHNLILTGAPGTGKTYLAKQIAQRIIFGEVKNKMTKDEEMIFYKQFAFVQFHPSYDYTDFVEGLRSVKDDTGNIGFERKDGVFKLFCKNAIEASALNNNPSFEKCWENFIYDVRTNVGKGLLTKIGSWEYGLSSKDSLKYQSVNTPSNYSFTITKKNILDTYEGRQARLSGAFGKDMKDIIEYMQQHYALPKYEKPQTISNKENKYVFVIDEINRGEISKIFGELFFSIDPGYRGEKGRVMTQYQNLIEDDVFSEGFYVPDNVYIIGTMNDIDRSVESMDFAMRRRFAWREITAKQSQSMIDDEFAWDGNKPEQKVIDDIKTRMDNLNACIIDEYDSEEMSPKDKIGLTKAYQIGASYFLKYRLYDNFDDLWINHIEGVLYEYLRGTTNIEAKIERLHKAYNDTTAH